MTLAYVAVGVVGLLVLVPLWFRPKLLVAVALIVIVFVRTVSHLTGVSAISNADDLFVVIVLARALVEARVGSLPRRYPGMKFFVAFALVGAVSALLSPYFSASVFFSGLFLATKGVILGWATSRFDWSPDDVLRLFRGGAVVLSLVLIATAANAAAPGAWASAFSVSGSTIERYGLPSLSGPFVHPFDLAYFAAMSAVAVQAYRALIRKGKFSAFLMVGATAATILSFRRKDLLGLVAAFFAVAGLTKNVRWFIGAVAIVPVLLFVIWDEVTAQFESLTASYLGPDSNEARTILTVNAVSVATDYAPFGAGFGRFGSRTAATDYSPEYVRLGMSSQFGLGPGKLGFFLTDTSWPAIIGEAGFLGAVVFIAALISIAIAARRWSRAESVTVRLVGITAIGWLILTAFQSTGAAVFTSPPAFATMFVLIGIGSSLERHENSKALVGAPLQGRSRHAR
jgi:hypothetical protein